MRILIHISVVASIMAGLVGCPAIESYKYMLTGRQDEPSPRTVDAAKAQFNDKDLTVAQATESDLRNLLGPPDSIKEEDEYKVYTYVRNVATRGFSTDIGTTYIAGYEFDKKGKLRDKRYWAQPMNVDALGGSFQ